MGKLTCAQKIFDDTVWRTAIAEHLALLESGDRLTKNRRNTVKKIRDTFQLQSEQIIKIRKDFLLTGYMYILFKYMQFLLQPSRLLNFENTCIQYLHGIKSYMFYLFVARDIL